MTLHGELLKLAAARILRARRPANSFLTELNKIAQKSKSPQIITDRPPQGWYPTTTSTIANPETLRTPQPQSTSISDLFKYLNTLTQRGAQASTIPMFSGKAMPDSFNLNIPAFYNQLWGGPQGVDSVFNALAANAQRYPSSLVPSDYIQNLRNWTSNSSNYVPIAGRGFMDGLENLGTLADYVIPTNEINWYRGMDRLNENFGPQGRNARNPWTGWSRMPGEDYGSLETLRQALRHEITHAGSNSAMPQSQQVSDELWRNIAHAAGADTISQREAEMYGQIEGLTSSSMHPASTRAQYYLMPTELISRMSELKSGLLNEYNDPNTPQDRREMIGRALNSPEGLAFALGAQRARNRENRESMIGGALDLLARDDSLRAASRSDTPLTRPLYDPFHQNWILPNQNYSPDSVAVADSLNNLVSEAFKHRSWRGQPLDERLYDPLYELQAREYLPRELIDILYRLQRLEDENLNANNWYGGSFGQPAEASMLDSLRGIPHDELLGFNERNDIESFLADTAEGSQTNGGWSKFIGDIITGRYNSRPEDIQNIENLWTQVTP